MSLYLPSLGMTLAMAWPGAPRAAAPLPQLTAVAVASNDTGVAISLSLTAKVAYRFASASKPARMVVTLRQARGAATLAMPAPQGPVTGVNVRRQANG